MKNKGFTLIELLAVIVILAIIALIATPIVLGIIEDSRESTNKLTAEFVIDAVESAYNVAYTQSQGATPTKKAVFDSFSMKNATWNSDTDKITAGDVECTVTEEEKNGQKELIVLCGYPTSEGPKTLESQGPLVISTSTGEASGN